MAVIAVVSFQYYGGQVHLLMTMDIAFCPTSGSCLGFFFAFSSKFVLVALFG
jgi:hypothetical protein